MKKFFTSSYWKGQRLLLLVFLLLHLVIAGVFISYQSITFDEMDYYAFGVKWAKGNAARDNRMYDSKTPLMVIAAIPRAVRQLTNPQYRASDFGAADILAGRYLMALFTLVIAAYLFRWIRHLFGPRAWIVPLLLFLFDPTVISFSMIITSDMATGACLLAIAWHSYRYCTTRTVTELLWFSISLAAGLLCKASLLYAVPAFMIAYLVYLFRTGWPGLRRSIAHVALSAFLVLLLVNAAYYFEGSGQPLRQSEWRSGVFRDLSVGPVTGVIPVPFPLSYLQALDLLKFHGDIGAGHPESTHHGTYVNGKIRYQGGFWYYYLFTGFYKIPVATLLLIFAGLISCMISGWRKIFGKHGWYLLPFLYFLFVLSVFNPFQSGFRHILLIYPLAFIIVAAGSDLLQRIFSNPAQKVLTALVTYMFISAAFCFPWLMSYTNEFTGDKKLVFRKINDSGISYGQNRAELKKFLASNPGYEPMPVQPKAGRFIISSTELVDFKSGRDCAWLSGFIPTRHYQYSMYLFDISEPDLARWKQKSRRGAGYEIIDDNR